MKIGKLQEVEIRNLWHHEQYDFSAWLVKDDNIALLNEKLGLTLVDINTEAYVGAYRCDIVAVDETTGIKVIIENQLENSNHDHLGKIITYASGLDAKIIVWIVKEARDEHRSAIEWLNNNTSKDINFFLIELHAYKIGDSDPAPMFQIIEQPNDFIKESKNNKSADAMNKRQSERVEFWTIFNEHIINRGKPFSVRKFQYNKRSVREKGDFTLLKKITIQPIGQQRDFFRLFSLCLWIHCESIFNFKTKTTVYVTQCAIKGIHSLSV